MLTNASYFMACRPMSDADQLAMQIAEAAAASHSNAIVADAEGGIAVSLAIVNLGEAMGIGFTQ